MANTAIRDRLPTVYPDGSLTGPPASESRGGSANLIDAALCLALAIPLGFAGFAAYASATDGGARGTWTTAALLWGAALLVSFVNHVLLGRWCGGSLGKLMLGLHVVRTEDGRRPRFWHLVGRWLAGLALVPFGVLILAIALAGAAGFDAPLSVSEWLGISSVHREVPDGPAVTRAERTAADEAAAKDPQLAAHEALVREKRARKDRAGEREAVARRVREGRGGRPAYGRRLGAALLDFVLTPVAGVVLWFAVLLSAPDDRLMDDTTLFWGALGGSCLLCSYLNRVLLNRTLHGTPGRRAFGIRLAVTKTGRQPGIPRLSLQWLLGLALAPLSFFFLLFGAAPPAQSLVGLTAVPARERGGPRITAPA